MKSDSPIGHRGDYKIGEPIDNLGIAKVIRSESLKLKQGDIILAFFPFQEYVIWVHPPESYRVIVNPANLPLYTYLGSAGLTGKTAYYGWRRFVEEKAKSGGTIFISSAAGAVGSFVVQLAKKAGLKVIGSTGSDEKVAFLKSLGVDVTINYKTEDLASILAKEGPIDIYWDHVGGDHLNAALESMSFSGVVVICGLASGYNNSQGHLPVKDISRVLFKGLSVYGLLVWQHE